MYSQPKTGVSFVFYIFLAGIAGVAWLGQRIKAWGQKKFGSKNE